MASGETWPCDRWYAWFNGSIVLETEVRVPFRDRGFKFGDGVFDTTRTFNHRIFKLQEHIDRLYRSLAYLRIDPGMSPKEMIEATEAVTEKNLAVTPKDEDIWITQRVTRGIDAAERGAWLDYAERTIIVECRPLPYKQRGKFYREGLRVVTPITRRPSPDTFSPRAKTQNYLNLVLGDLEAKDVHPDAVGVLLRHQRQLGRRARQQHLSGSRRQDSDATRALRPAWRQPGDGDRPRAAGRHRGG